MNINKFRGLFHQEAEALISLVTPELQPNSAAIMRILREVDMLALSVKFFGYELAKRLAAELPSIPSDFKPYHVGLGSKPSTQSDMESDWVGYWCSELKVSRVFHRKLWEFAYVLQAIYEAGCLRRGARGLGFGCGTEPLPSYLAAQGIDVTVTDLDPESSKELGWIATNQHTASLDFAFHADLVDRISFDRHVSLRYVDMNNIPVDLLGFDFNWSICALEHLGSIEKGLAFVENSLNTLRSGGVAVHTTEFNFLNDDATIDNWGTVLFQKRHFCQLAERLTSAGHQVAPLDFNVGNKPMDRFIDIPPWVSDRGAYTREMWGAGNDHLKLSIDGFASTCFGLLIRKA